MSKQTKERHPRRPPADLPTGGGRFVRDTPTGPWRRADKKALAAEAESKAKADAKAAPAEKPAKTAK